MESIEIVDSLGRGAVDWGPRYRTGSEVVNDENAGIERGRRAPRATLSLFGARGNKSLRPRSDAPMNRDEADTDAPPAPRTLRAVDLPWGACIIAHHHPGGVVETSASLARRGTERPFPARSSDHARGSPSEPPSEVVWPTKSEDRVAQLQGSPTSKCASVRAGRFPRVRFRFAPTVGSRPSPVRPPTVLHPNRQNQNST